MQGLTEPMAAAWLRRHAFPPARAPGRWRIGAEVELLAFAESCDVALYLQGHGPLARFLDDHARRAGWSRRVSATGIPMWCAPTGGAISLEPGGQVEYSTPAFASARELLTDIRDVLTALARDAAASGIRLTPLGIDPHNPIERVPLQLQTPRYLALDAHFARDGDAGRRMMRQTAAVQINVDAMHAPLLTWRVLNAMAPCVLALTANSRVHAGADTGHASYRARTWRELDASRTGLLGHEIDAAAEYARFAFAAEPVVSEPFGAGWQEHLTTLFPEVRPRGWYELRTADAVHLEVIEALVMLVSAIVTDARALHEAAELLGRPSDALLERAGVLGTEDAELAGLLRELVDIAAAAARRVAAPEWDAGRPEAAAAR
jgi:glutamate--cysteine ligase